MYVYIIYLSIYRHILSILYITLIHPFPNPSSHLNPHPASPLSALKQPPVLDLEALQYPLPNCPTLPHQLRLPALRLRLRILAWVVRDVDADYYIRPLLLQA